jgi:hypothetical protein
MRTHHTDPAKFEQALTDGNIGQVLRLKADCGARATALAQLDLNPDWAHVDCARCLRGKPAEYRRITANDLTTDPMAVEVRSNATGEWHAVTARVAKMSGGAEVIVTTNPGGGGKVYPKSHGITARVAVQS